MLRRSCDRLEGWCSLGCLGGAKGREYDFFGDEGASRVSELSRDRYAGGIGVDVDSGGFPRERVEGDAAVRQDLLAGDTEGGIALKDWFQGDELSFGRSRMSAGGWAAAVESMVGMR
jgi:hypothetical protein